MEATTPPALCGDNFTDDNYANITLNVPIGTKAIYAAAENWKNFKNIVEVDFTCIDNIEAEGAEGNSVYYDLGGRPVNEPVKGSVYIVDGKKVVL